MCDVVCSSKANQRGSVLCTCVFVCLRVWKFLQVFRVINYFDVFWIFSPPLIKDYKRLTMDWIASKDFPEEMKNTVRNLDSSLNEIEEIVTDLTSTPLADAHSTVKSTWTRK